MNAVIDITAAVAGFQPLATPQNLNKRTVRTGQHQSSRAEIQHPKNREGKTLQGLTTEASEPSESFASLPPDQAAWLPVAKQILAGEFEDADRPTRESLRIGLRSINHPLCQRALQCLATKPDRR
jgi:hypothetical protein